MIDTLYGQIDSALFDKFSKIRLIAFDVDGVFSDGRIYLGNAGEELKAFHTKDGYGIKSIIKLDIQVAIITGRESLIVKNRMDSLGVQHVIQGQEQKKSTLSQLQSNLGIDASATMAMGDDMPDVGMFEVSELGIATSDAHPFVKRQAAYVTQIPGGFGAVREICDLILQAHGQLAMQHSASI